MPTITGKIRDLLFGRPFGELFPPKANPPPLAVDGRTVALETLAAYIATLDFFRPGDTGGPPTKFRIPESNFHIEWPDYVEEMVFPSIAVVHSRASYDVIGLVSYVEESTRDVYAPGTVLQWQAEYVETINLEVWTSKKAERRSLLAGLETAFSPTEQMSGLRFRMPNYFNELVCFTLLRREVMDEPDSPKNRRRAQLEMQMRFNIVSLVNYTTMKPQVQVTVDFDQLGIAVDLSVDKNAQQVPPIP
jgi:hypothetical protein